MKTLFFLLGLFCFSLHATKLDVVVKSPIAILVNAKTGDVLYEKNAYKKVPPASITKVASALYALECNINLDEIATVPLDCIVTMSRRMKAERGYKIPPHWLQNDGTHISLQKGEKVPLRDLLYAHIIASANDASNVIAHHVGGSIPQFMSGLNSYLQSIGCHATHFHNPHGLFHPGHVTTAYDFSLIFRKALEHEELATILGTEKYTIEKNNKSAERDLRILSGLIRPTSMYYYQKAIAMKTGVNDEAGYTLATAAESGERKLVAVIMQSPSSRARFNDAKALFEAAFNETKMYRSLFNAEENVFTTNVKGARRPIKAVLHDNVGITYYPSEEKELHATISWHDIQMPVAKDDLIGDLHIEDADGNVISTYPLYALEEGVPKVRRSAKFFLWLGLFLTFAIAVIGFRKFNKSA